MNKEFNKEVALASLHMVTKMLEEGCSRTEFSNMLISTMGHGVCDLHCITTETSFLQTILDMLPVPVYYKDIYGIFIGCNNALANLYNKTKDQIVGKTVFDIFTREEAEMLTTSDTVLLNEKNNEIIEHRGRFSAMGNRYYVIHKKVIMTPIGTPAGVLGVIMDITEQKESEERAWQGEAFYKSLYEHSPRARVIFDDFNMIEDMNLVAVKLFSDGSLLIGSDISALFESYADFDKVLSSGGLPVKVKLRGIREEAVDVLVSLTVSSVSELARYAVSFIVMDTIL